MSVSWPSGCGLCCTHSHPVSTQTLGLPPQKNLQQDTEAKLLRNHGEQASQTKTLLAQPEQQTCNHECPQIKSRSLLVNMPDLVQKHSGYSQLWPLWPAHSQNRAGSCICQIRLPGQVWAKRIWSRNKLVCKNHWAQFWQNATGPLPVSHFLTWLHSSTDGPDNIVHNQPGSNLVLADRIRFWTNGSSQEASRCARITQPASGQCF